MILGIDFNIKENYIKVFPCLEHHVGVSKESIIEVNLITINGVVNFKVVKNAVF